MGRQGQDLFIFISMSIRAGLTAGVLNTAGLIELRRLRRKSGRTAPGAGLCLQSASVR
jgi:hypothetical protein